MLHRLPTASTGVARSLWTAAFLVLGMISAACAPMPIPTAVSTRADTPRPVTTPRSQVIADAGTAAPSTPTVVLPTSFATSTPEQGALAAVSTPTPAPVTFVQQRITNLFDLARLPVMEHSVATQFTSRNWVSLEHYFDYFIDDGNFAGPNYGYLDEAGELHAYRIVPGYDGAAEYEVVPRVPGPGSIDRIWFAYHQHQSLNNPKDMSQEQEWNNWGNLGAMGRIRFYFDDEPTPRLDLGIKDLFVGKHPFPAPLTGFYASANGGNINYVPIPFQRSIRVTTTGRPRLMQIQLKRFTTNPGELVVARGQAASESALPMIRSLDLTLGSPVRSFEPVLDPGEQAALGQAAQAWQTCTPYAGEYRSFPLVIEPDNSAEVAFSQPGVVAGMRVRVPETREESVWVQVFWDGESQPSIMGPLRALFGTAERLLPYRSLPLGIIPDGADLIFYNNFPMPFRSARFVFLNHSGEPLPLTFEAAAREPIPGAANTRLHAFFGKRRVMRREDDADNYTVIDVQGSGKFLGMVLSAWDLDRDALNGPLDKNWRFPYLESNVDVWTDGRLALPGTGIEDDFNASYYYVFAGYPNYPTKYCLAGLTLMDHDTPLEPSSQYRFYLNDAPEFQNNLRVSVQHGNKGNNLTVTYSSTAFWYQLR